MVHHNGTARSGVIVAGPVGRRNCRTGYHNSLPVVSVPLNRVRIECSNHRDKQRHSSNAWRCHANAAAHKEEFNNGRYGQVGSRPTVCHASLPQWGPLTITTSYVAYIAGFQRRWHMSLRPRQPVRSAGVSGTVGAWVVMAANVPPVRCPLEGL